jgi:deferrochelatase/peroxidase EfeB
MAQAIEVDYGDIQGLARFGHGRLKEACYLLLRVADRAAAQDWLRAAPVTTAVTMSSPPDTALQVAFTSQGLKALGVPDAAIAGFSDEFLTGMAAEPSRSRRLGDVNIDAPAQWAWGGTDATTPHLVVMLFAREGKLEAWERKVTGRYWSRAFEPPVRLATLDIGPIEPFGFADGISQPQIDWNCELTLDGRDKLEFGNVLALGEVLLGYRNEYGLLSERPVLDPAFDEAAESLPPALDAPHRRDLGRNGSYLVFRQLEQDVPGFWRFVDEQAGHDEQQRSALADAMVGRRRDGTPLIPPTSKLIAGIASNRREHENNGFLYEDDPAGVRCPLGAHIRRANPRTGDLPGGVQPLWRRLVRMLGFKRQGFRDDMVAATRFHRLVRRGRAYGSVLSPEAALAQTSEPAEPRGLHFICLGANISRQFEFVQNAWMMNAKFDGLSDESDPLTGNREALFGGGRTDRFSLPRADGPPRRLEGLPRFVTVRGGAYFLLPGIRALSYIAEPRP